MSFLLLAIGPFCYALTNFIDKALLQRYFANGGAGTILISSALISMATLPLLYLTDPTVMEVSTPHIAALAVVGALNLLVLFCYLKALEAEDVSAAIIFYQLVPVIAYGLGYLFLGETLTEIQMVAMLIVIGGTSMVAVEFDELGRVRLRGRTAVYMVLASTFWAAGAVVFKAVALEERVVRSLFWENMVLGAAGICLLLTIPASRNTFVKGYRSNTTAVLLLSLANEALYILGNIAMAFAYLQVPVSLALLANSYQSIFALLISALIYVLRPDMGASRLSTAQIVRRITAIVVAGTGTYLLL
jgi:drug/metabolite transporter (DMT)-like permease